MFNVFVELTMKMFFKRYKNGINHNKPSHLAGRLTGPKFSFPTSVRAHTEEPY